MDSSDGRHAVFINFRSADSGSYAAVYLDEILPRVFGPRNVFFASRSIPSGTRFADVLDEGLRCARVLLVLIGRDWLTCADQDGRRLLDQQGDWVRREIAESLRSGIPVIPVLLTGASLPTRAQLPPDIADLADRQAVHLRHQHVGPDAEYLIREIRRVAPELAVELSPGAGPSSPALAHRPMQARFRGLIAEKTRDFVGREHVFEEIDAWIASNPHGYFTVRGDPGVGKSAIIARYTQRNDCLIYFNQRASGLTRAAQFLDSVLEQITERFAVRVNPGRTEDGPVRTVLSEVLDDVAPQLAGIRLVIAVDALDEVDLSAQERGTNVLYLPPYLPDGVFFVLTQRQVPLPLVADAPVHTLDLMDPRFRARNRVDAEEYLGRTADIPGVQEWISRQGLSRAGYVGQLAAKSDANFMYLRYVVADIAAGRLHDRSAGSLPEGLQQYYAGHWRLMGMDSSPVPRIKLKVLYILLEYQQPISVQLLAELSGEPTATVAEVIREWSQFLRGEGAGSQAVYSFYHESFADFLRHDDVLVASGIDLAGINELIARRLFDGGERSE